VIRAIEHNRGEIDVAPLPLRAGTMLAGLAPEIAAIVTRKSGGEQISSSVASGQRDKR
jgi:hypothetical protein